MLLHTVIIRMRYYLDRSKWEFSIDNFFRNVNMPSIFYYYYFILLLAFQKNLQYPETIGYIF